MGFSLIEIMIVIALIAILSSILLPSFVRARSQGRLTGCHQNLHHIATALESYMAENSSHYPQTLTPLTPRYISTIPTCPSAGTNAPYTGGFSSTSNPDAYSIICAGTHHGELGMPANYPQYLSGTGLLDK